MLYNGASLWGRIIGIYSTLATPFFQFFTKYFLIDNNLSTKKLHLKLFNQLASIRSTMVFYVLRHFPYHSLVPFDFSHPISFKHKV